MTVMRETGMVVEVDHPVFGPILRQARRCASRDRRRGSPRVASTGSTPKILGELGYDEEAIGTLEADGVIHALR